MSDHGFCPTCGIPWPNFCPIDGKRLSGPWTCANAPKPVLKQPVIEPSPAAVAPEPPARPAASARAPEPAPVEPAAPRRQPDTELMKDFVDNVGSRSPIAKSRAPARARAQDDLRNAQTLIQPQLTDELIEQAKARAAERAAAQAAAVAPEAPAERKKRARGEFSDTQWFMKGLNLQVADPDTGQVAVDEGEYLVDEEIPEEDRRRFTLRKKHEE